MSTQQARPDEAWSALMAQEGQAVRARRRMVLGEAAAGRDSEVSLPRVGLALSGGGVRSATFALGLLRGMAQSHSDQHPGRQQAEQRTLSADGLLGRIDYLSTVSGGGYTGAMLGRLVCTRGLDETQALLCDSGSPVLQWLRRYGRYLSPAGSRDIGVAIVTYLRAVLAIHAEFMVACMLLGLVVIAPHLFQHSLQLLAPAGWESWQTAWWTLAVTLWIALAPGLITGYWAARDHPDPSVKAVGPGLCDLVFLAATGTGAYLLLRSLWVSDALNLSRDGLSVPVGAGLALASIAIGQGWVQFDLLLKREPHALAVARLRQQMTGGLRRVTLAALALVLLGALDIVSWWVLEELQSGNDVLWGGFGLGGVAALALRTIVQPLQQMAAEAQGKAREWLPRLFDLLGVVGLTALVVAWLVLMQWFVFAPDTFSAFVNTPPYLRAALVTTLWAAWVLLTAGNAQMPNTSSLHSFYRARLTRAYLGAANLQRGGLADQESSHSDVTKVVEGDDMALSSYQPEACGGPIHLINTALNQTRDDRSGLYNADRKGAAVTATWRGLEIGPSRFVPLGAGGDAGTLGRWIAISGAAASPGAGAYTSRGLALLLYFLGVRLGYWVRTPRQAIDTTRARRLLWRLIPKPMMLFSEGAAIYHGAGQPWWYLSDGGHFDNTGVYALLKRELDFIILSDAGCDSRYEFGDIENLVRKARIDFGAEIDFYACDDAQRLFTLAGAELTVLSPEDMDDNHSCRGVLLARIRYRERPDPRYPGSGRVIRPEGTLLVVKPNLHNALDVDLLAYAQKHPAFPHEPTSDQSFDEAQWESYHRLGQNFGKALSDTWLSQLPGWRAPAQHGLHVAARLRNGREPEAARTEPLWRRAARATAIGTTLGVGASGTLLLSVWQLFDQVQRNESDARTEARQLFTDVSKGLQDFDGACSQVPEHVVTQTETLLVDLRGSRLLRPLERSGIDRLVGRLAEQCTLATESAASCTPAQQRVRADLCALALKPVTENTALNYWHPGASPAEQTRAARTAWHEFSQTWGGLLPQRLAHLAPTSANTPRVLVAGDDAEEVPAGPRGGSAPPASPVVPTDRPPEPPAAAAMQPGPRPQPAPYPSPGTATRAPRFPPAGTPGASPPAAAPPGVPNEGRLRSCRRPAGASIVYVQIYDEASRMAAQRLRQAMQAQGAGAVQVAPIENVTRSADLRERRRPVPWPQATFVLHDPDSRRCALALSRALGPPWVMRGETGKVWIRDLASSLERHPGVIELWLPPVGAMPGKAAAF